MKLNNVLTAIAAASLILGSAPAIAAPSNPATVTESISTLDTALETDGSAEAIAEDLTTGVSDELKRGIEDRIAKKAEQARLKAERAAERAAAKAEKAAEKAAAKAERAAKKAEREARRAEHKAARDAAKVERKTAQKPSKGGATSGD